LIITVHIIKLCKACVNIYPNLTMIQKHPNIQE